jgi:hypothetical protein
LIDTKDIGIPPLPLAGGISGHVIWGKKFEKGKEKAK